MYRNFEHSENEELAWRKILGEVAPSAETTASSSSSNEFGGEENQFVTIAATLGNAGEKSLLTSKGVSLNKLMEMSE